MRCLLIHGVTGEFVAEVDLPERPWVNDTITVEEGTSGEWLVTSSRVDWKPWGEEWSTKVKVVRLARDEPEGE